MTDDTVGPQRLFEKTSDADLLREMIGFAADRLMALEMDGLCGAGHGERSADRSNQRNGYRERLWETRRASREPVRKLPYKFRYKFRCDDDRCNGHMMMNEDWELGRLYWRHIDSGDSEEAAIAGVRQRFFTEMCAPSNETYFFVGTVLGHGTWVVLGTFYPKIGKSGGTSDENLELFPKDE